MKRHTLSSKKAKQMTKCRKEAASKDVIESYFDLLEKTMADLNISDIPLTASIIWMKQVSASRLKFRLLSLCQLATDQAFPNKFFQMTTLHWSMPYHPLAIFYH